MITLASDFGSPYPAAMRAAIRQHSDAELLDVAHDLPRQDVRTAAFWLREVLPYVPPAVHCAVVDPGVGSDRAAIALRVGEHALVAPDNGLVLPAARRLLDPPPVAGSGLRGVETDDPGSSRGTGATAATTTEDAAPGIEAFEIVVNDPASSTFHGRDVFAPAAVLIHERGVDEMESCSFLEPTEEYVDLGFPDPEFSEGADAAEGDGDEGDGEKNDEEVAEEESEEAAEEGGERIDGEVLVVDGFGNAITNVPGAILADRGSIEVDGTTWPVADHYAAVNAGEGLVTVGSHGNVELAVNRGRGTDRFDVDVGSSISLR